MEGKSDSRRGPRRIDAAAKAAFLAALRGGARREDAAAGAGFSLTGFYGARRRDRAFAAAWEQALAAPPADARRARAYAERGEVRIAPANRRVVQRRRRRHVRFDERRQALFLAHFAATCDTKAAAWSVGVSQSTVHLHCRTDPAFAAAYREALKEGYVWLQAEAARQRLAAQERLRAAIEAAGAVTPPALTAEAAEEFERTMKLLARWQRGPRRPDGRFAPGGRRQAWTFDRAMHALQRRMKALGLWPPKTPPEEAGAGEDGA